MGWFGYGIYDGDETQTLHLEFLKWAKVKVVNQDDCLRQRKTIVPKDQWSTFANNLSLISKKLPKQINTEDEALEWQMFAALIMDNGLYLPLSVYKKAKKGTEWLMQHQVKEFDNPSLRRKALKRFIARMERNLLNE